MCQKLDKQFCIELLPALHGDCIWIEYGNRSNPNRILIDGGPIGAYEALDARINKLRPGNRKIELTIITHVDADHIEGVIRLIAEKYNSLDFHKIWFNGWKHLETVPGMLGPVQGEFVSALISKCIGDGNWNTSDVFNGKTDPFKGKTLVVANDGLPPVANLEGGMQLTLLSPTPEKLEKLRNKWITEVNEKGIEPGDLDEALEQLREQHRLVPKGLLGGSFQLGDERIKLDDKEANGSSLAMLAEYGGKSCLFLGDSHPDAIVQSLKKLGASKVLPMKVDAIKVSHHGSRGNTTPELLDLVSCKRFLISTNGSHFKNPHPHHETIDMIISKAGPGVELVFNYFCETTKPWSKKSDQDNPNFISVYPKSEGESIIVSL